MRLRRASLLTDAPAENHAPAPPAAAAAAKTEIMALYQKHNPYKLQEVDSLIAKYGEGQLLRMIRKKYGVVAATSAAAATPLPPPSSDGGEQDSSPFTATFTAAGSLGLKLHPNQRFGSVDILGVNVGTQAEQVCRASLHVVAVFPAPLCFV